MKKMTKNEFFEITGISREKSQEKLLKMFKKYGRKVIKNHPKENENLSIYLYLIDYNDKDPNETGKIIGSMYDSANMHLYKLLLKNFPEKEAMNRFLELKVSECMDIQKKLKTIEKEESNNIQ